MRSEIDAWDWGKIKPNSGMPERKLVNISLESMLSEILGCIVNYRDYPTYYWYHEDNGYIEVVECDLYRGRIYMADGDFSEFDWELQESRLYKEVL